ncbi:MAG: Hit-like protein involved in cell-cycle regulation [Parcubacteria group bacterium Gr01-1014_18]|nr:MAG: Hit-like protein involved in cell-cycle regulation [Parcubacteria group bacterium Greene0416_36]TSC81449.1 MAG: Hit-like protein involved in cell-cycle regulation [Parcubacteria group bacterium Gr01-1014_18]TSC99047.1 MAG: Hit-like protein involved in cell-cycle regulation [Parcubacteria group bacterium Greene1014_20]TSD07272.1 MAG: Hit-like protein involved in cell-cycle regulation [Parcubacteria group bacterium Greene0714_2]
MNDCIFCKIIKKEVGAEIIAENEHAFAFLDICPINKGHTLVIPKKHFVLLDEVSKELLGELMIFTQKIAGAVCRSLGTTDYNIFQRNGPLAGQVVKHVHIHIVPRFGGDGHREWPTKMCYREGEIKACADKIKSFL